MLIRLFTSVLGCYLMFASSIAWSGPKEVKALLLLKFKNLPEEIVVSALPVGGLYEINSFGKVGYTNEKVDFYITGESASVIDLNKLEDLTALRKGLRAQEFVKSLPSYRAIKKVYGKGTDVVYTFENPHCPFCQMFHEDLEKNRNQLNLTVYTFLVPLKKFPEADNKIIAIYCTKPENQLNLWNLYSDPESKQPESKELCTKGSDYMLKNRKLFDNLELNATPTILFETGNKTAGFKTAKELIELLKLKN